jgi:hypothetical protein
MVAAGRAAARRNDAMRTIVRSIDRLSESKRPTGPGDGYIN